MDSCNGKKKYATFSKAQEALRSMIKREAHTSKGYLKPYRCDNHFHLGSGTTKGNYGSKKEVRKHVGRTPTAFDRARSVAHWNRLVEIRREREETNKWCHQLQT